MPKTMKKEKKEFQMNEKVQKLVDEIMNHPLKDPIRALILMLYFEDDKALCLSDEDIENLHCNTIGELFRSSETVDFLVKRKLIYTNFDYRVCYANYSFHCNCHFYLTEKGQKLAKYIGETDQWRLDELYESEEAVANS